MLVGREPFSVLHRLFLTYKYLADNHLRLLQHSAGYVCVQASLAARPGSVCCDRACSVLCECATDEDVHHPVFACRAATSAGLSGAVFPPAVHATYLHNARAWTGSLVVQHCSAPLWLCRARRGAGVGIDRETMCATRRPPPLSLAPLKRPCSCTVCPATRPQKNQSTVSRPGRN